MNQTELGAVLSRSLGTRVTQATISRWELGGAELTVEQVRALERTLGLEPGDLLRRSGYL